MRILCRQCAAFLITCMQHQVILFTYPSEPAPRWNDFLCPHQMLSAAAFQTCNILHSTVRGTLPSFYALTLDNLAGGGSSQAFSAALAQAVGQGGSASATAFANAFSSRGGCTSVRCCHDPSLPLSNISCLYTLVSSFILYQQFLQDKFSQHTHGVTKYKKMHHFFTYLHHQDNRKGIPEKIYFCCFCAAHRQSFVCSRE